MKKNAIVLCTLGLVFLMVGICQAAPYFGPIVMVEADPGMCPGDGETDVTVSLNFYDQDWILGEWKGNAFVEFNDEDDDVYGTQVTKTGGTVVDFAIKKNDGTVLMLSQKNHAVNFTNPNSGFVEAPTWVTEWYDDADIVWANGPSIPIQIVITDGDPDGLAAVPIPASALLLGSGMVGLIAFGQRMRKKVF